jgi:hypothetical protein
MAPLLAAMQTQAASSEAAIALLSGALSQAASTQATLVQALTEASAAINGGRVDAYA